MTLHWTCRYCRGAFTTEITDEQMDAMRKCGLTALKPSVCDNCDNREYRLTAEDEELCKQVAFVESSVRLKLTSHWRAMSVAYKRRTRGLEKTPLTVSQMRGMSRYDQMVAKVNELAKSSPPPTQQKKKAFWNRD